MTPTTRAGKALLRFLVDETITPGYDLTNEAHIAAVEAEAREQGAREADLWKQRAIDLYWCRLMEMQGGPDGSDHDEAVEQDARAATDAIGRYMDEEYPGPTLAYPDPIDALHREGRL